LREGSLVTAQKWPGLGAYARRVRAELRAEGARTAGDDARDEGAGVPRGQRPRRHHGTVPFTREITPREADPLQHEADLLRERCLLFVACTRAREALSVTWSGARSPFLPAATA
jgi:hypothetical protein